MSRIQEQDSVYCSTLHEDNNVTRTGNWTQEKVPSCLTASVITPLPLKNILPVSIDSKFSVGIKATPTPTMVTYKITTYEDVVGISTTAVIINKITYTWAQLGFSAPEPLRIEFEFVGTSTSRVRMDVYINGSWQYSTPNLTPQQPSLSISSNSKCTDVYFKSGALMQNWNVREVRKLFNVVGTELNRNGRVSLISDGPVSGRLTLSSKIRRVAFDPDRIISHVSTGVHTRKQSDTVGEYRLPVSESSLDVTELPSVNLATASTPVSTVTENLLVSKGVIGSGWDTITSFVPTTALTLELECTNTDGLCASQEGLYSLELFNGVYSLDWLGADSTLQLPFSSKIAITYDNGIISLIGDGGDVTTSYALCTGSNQLTLTESVRSYSLSQSVCYRGAISPTTPVAPEFLSGSVII